MNKLKNLSYEEYKKLREKEENKFFKKKNRYSLKGKLFNIKYKGNLV